MLKNFFRAKFLIFFSTLLFAGVTEAMYPFAQQPDEEAFKKAYLRYESSIFRRKGIFYKYLPGRIVFVVGTSSAGKTSMIRRVTAGIKNKEDFVFTGTDDISNYALINIVKAVLISYKKVSNIIPINLLIDCLGLSPTNPPLNCVAKIISNNVAPERRECFFSEIWKPLVDNIEQISCEQYQKIRMSLIERQLIQSLVSRKTVIVDAVSIDEFVMALEHNFIKCHIDTVVLYCSPSKVLKHILARNAMDAVGELRLFFPFSQYESLYTPGDNFDQKILVKKSDFSISLKKATLKLCKSAVALSDDIENASSWEDNCRRSLLQSWFSRKESIYIGARLPYSILIDNSNILQDEDLERIKNCISF